MSPGLFIESLRGALTDALGKGWTLSDADDEYGAFDLLNAGAPNGVRAVLLLGDEESHKDAPRGLCGTVNLRLIVQIKRGLEADKTAAKDNLAVRAEELRMAVLSICPQVPGEPDYNPAPGSDWRNLHPPGDARHGSPHPEVTPLRYTGGGPYRIPFPDVLVEHPCRELRFACEMAFNLDAANPFRRLDLPVSA